MAYTVEDRKDTFDFGELMKPTAEIWFVHDLENGWYNMKEPSGLVDGWNVAVNALNFCKKEGWDLKWVGDARYMPDFFIKQ